LSTFCASLVSCPLRRSGLPDCDFQHRIKSVGEAYERVAKESQLERDR
jgi:hypothetical protein